ncbi:MAG: rod shape-determining protein MreD [Candidatus Hydrogenedentes bacterium]|nr:rod shape-determining protein MreD [Candidatus Hydrogenedentota bacterium]
MYRAIAWALAIIAAALVQTTWLSVIKVEGVIPNLPLLLVVYFAVNDGEERAMFTGLIAGVFRDVAGDTTLGHYVLCNVLVGYLAARISHRLVTDHPAVKTGLVFSAALVHGMLYTLLLYVQKPDIGAIHMILNVVVPESLYTAIVTPVVFFFLALCFGRRLSHPAGAT